MKYHSRPVSTVIVLLTLRKGKLSVLLHKLSKSGGMWSLPESLLFETENLNTCVKRALEGTMGIKSNYLEQFCVYSDPSRAINRDISVAYLAVCPLGKLRLKANKDLIDINWFEISDLPKLYLDHNRICNDGIQYSRSFIERKPSLAFAFHKGGFTLTELQKTFAAFGKKIFSPENKRNFRLWLKNYSDGKGLVIETDKFREGNHRPARIYEPNLEALVEQN